ncbi:MAG: transcriptional regulator [Chloroflexota bacterium]|nr:MAG: transcriptional regulator [Chloroflexota bacterium]
MGLSAEIRQQLINSFKAEQSEHVQKINQGLLALEKNPPVPEQQAILKEIFREAHSLKGAARAVGVTIVESLGHALEELLLAAKESRLTFSPELFDLLYQALDAVELVMAQLEAGQSAPPAAVLELLTRLEETARGSGEQGSKGEASPSGVAEPQASVGQEPGPEGNEREDTASPHPALPPALPPSNPTDETIRVSVSKLDALMAQFSELLSAKIRAEQRLAEVRQMQNLAADWQKEWQSLRSHYNRLLRNGPKTDGRPLAAEPKSPASRPSAQQPREITALVDFLTHNQDQLRTFNAQANTLYRQLANDTLRMSLVINELQEEIKRVRMLPLRTITATFARMVRDLAREQGKQINLSIWGGETELDKRVLEQIKDPLIHLLRNAVDHGLERPEFRQQAGKPAEGQITLSANQQGHNIVITISDDGSGLDLAAIRLAAVRRGLRSHVETEKMSDTEVANLIFDSGLSTSKIITDISGRGVGLDVVRQNVEALQGILDVSSAPGQGTTFTLTLPLTLASSHGLLVRSGEQVFALPLTTVERMLQVKASDVATVSGKEAIIYQGKPVALARLSDLLELPASGQEADRLTVVIIAVAEKRLGLIVDDLVGEQEIVVKSLGKQLVKVGGLAGATVLGSGQVMLVLHAADLVKLATRALPKTSATSGLELHQPAELKTILVVDDSITTRTLEKNILEAAGYEVKLATDGEEALGVLATDGLPHLIVSDINMPRLDGFDLTYRVKHDTRYANIPVILVTSLDSPADKARGIEVGADAYIVKSRFDQGSLLDTIEQLI